MSKLDILDTRSRILDAAERLLGRYGYRKMTIDDIATEAGIGRRTVYVHFSGKEEIFLASIERVIQQVLGGLRAIDAAQEDAPEKLRQMLVARVLIRFDSVRPYFMGLASLFEGLRAGYMESRQRFFEAEAALFARSIAEGIAAGTIAPTDPEATAWTLLRMTNSLLLYALSPGELEDRAIVEAQASQIAALAVRGLRP